MLYYTITIKSYNNTYKEADNMTPRELRALLFQIDNKNLTVKELRNKLFDLTNRTTI